MLTLDGANGIVLPDGSKEPADNTRSMIRLNTANGWGSTNTPIRRFLNLVTSSGTDITYADSATLGASFTINVGGVYTITYGDAFTVQGTMGLSLNTSQPTVSIISLAASEVLIDTTPGAGNAPGAVSWTGYLPAGSVIRAHTGTGLVTGTPANSCQFTIVRVS